MRKRILVFSIFCTITATATAAGTRDAKLTNTTGYNYNYMYPYMNNKMRTDLNPGVTTSQSLNPINTVVKTTQLAGNEKRRVVSRPTTARAATSSTATTTSPKRRVVARSTTNARAANPYGATASPARVGSRRGVVARPSTARTARDDNNNRLYDSNRDTNSYASDRVSNTPTISRDTERMTSSECLASYTECMNQYCERPETAYNRCYCSSKLAQIDAEYQSTIDNMIKQITSVQNNNQWTDEEMNEYWMEKVGNYTDSNSWAALDEALNIDWSSTENRIRGQNAFVTGHEYCSRYLRGCYYMAGNLRDAYRTQIARDCDAYEYSLQKIKTAAESIIEANK